MMAIGDVEGGDLEVELLDVLDAGLVVDDPELVLGVVEIEMSNAIRFSGGKGAGVVSELAVCLSTVCEENAADVSVLDIDCLGSIGFWSGTGLLVLLDEALEILLA